MEIRSADWEVMAFFGCEPKLLDAGVPWCYNRVSFETEEASRFISCTIEPGDDYFHVIVRDPLYGSVDIELTTVEYLKVLRSDNAEWLVVVTRDTQPLVLVLAFLPTLCVRLRMASAAWTITELSGRP